MGAHPRFTVDLVHHVETVMSVPYRCTKEFMHPVATAEGVVRQPFHLDVWYRGMDFERDHNRKIFAHFAARGGEIATAPLGNGLVYGFSLCDFYRSCLDLFSKDIYCWLTRPPAERPYQR